MKPQLIEWLAAGDMCAEWPELHEHSDEHSDLGGHEATESAAGLKARQKMEASFYLFHLLLGLRWHFVRCV